MDKQRQDNNLEPIYNSSVPIQDVAWKTSWERWTIIFTNPSARAGYDTRSIFKRSLTGLNSEFFFS